MSENKKIYIDHTGRWYEEYSPEEINVNDPLIKIMNEEITKEIDKEFIKNLKIF